MTLDAMLRLAPYSLAATEKGAWLFRTLNELTVRHRRQCAEYERLLSVMWPGSDVAKTMAELPFLPVGLFKSHRLASVPEAEIFKTLTSSGTTSQQVSRIYLDRETAGLQTSALVSIMSSVLGPRRLPMLILDTTGILKNRTQFSARAAGVLGMSSFGAHHFYALDEQMQLDVEGLKGFLSKHGGQPFLMFGFTFMVWQYFYQQVRDLGLDLSNGILIHSGGWKKLQEVAVSNEAFKRSLRDACGISRSYNFYGMVEQVGSVFLEGDDGFLYTPNFADVVVRDPVTWEEAPVGQVGVIQVLSALPRSYPGHSLLTEDLGIVHGVDSGKAGRRGKYFSVIGRVPKAELRGCSDTHAFDLRSA